MFDKYHLLHYEFLFFSSGQVLSIWFRTAVLFAAI